MAITNFYENLKKVASVAKFRILTEMSDENITLQLPDNMHL